VDNDQCVFPDCEDVEEQIAVLRLGSCLLCARDWREHKSLAGHNFVQQSELNYHGISAPCVQLGLGIGLGQNPGN
jgi:hypothetical protein